jgi:putative CocE/NonD family hydrolase
MTRSPLADVTVLRDLMVSMRDGTRLATDVYLPAAVTTPLPVILERTPYDKSGVSRSERSMARPVAMTRPEVAAWFARRGFAVVMQDVRGRYGSEGEFTKYVSEAEDGYDTLEWLRARPWCNGRIGTMGVSYGAHVQLALACLAPPGLACMFMDSGGFWSAFHGGIRRGGAFELKQATWAYRHALLSPKTAKDPARRAALDEVDLVAWFRDMPWWPGHSPLAAAPEYEAYLFEQWREGRFTDYWKRPGLCADGFYAAIPDVPVAIVGSWYDPYVTTCTRNFAELSACKRSAITLLMGPWTHGDRSCSFAGEVDFGPLAPLDGNVAADYLSLRLAWFERWLKPAGHARPIEPPVAYFQMGGGPGGLERGRLRHGGRWRRCSTWPPPAAAVRTLHLHRDGRLADAAPASSSGFVEYRFDPRDPVPTVGGALTSGDPVMAGGAFDQRVGPGTFTYRADHPEGPLAERDDVVCFETDPLDRDLVVTGEPVAELWVSTDCPDTDFTVKLVDVYPPGEDLPQGFAMNVTDGIFRLRYREGWDREVPAEPGRVYRIRIRPFATSNLFRKGHRLRIDISSSNYPHFDINPNTGGPQDQAGEPRIATNRIHCSAVHASRILLPVMPAGEEGRDAD